MSKGFSGLAVVNVELSTRCNKNCWMCGRRKVERDHPDLALNYRDMNFELVRSISKELPGGIVVQFHNNGEALLHPRFGDAVRLFKRQIKAMDTNGKLMIEKADEIIGNLDTLTISAFEKDDENEEQYELIKKFLRMKKDRRPNVIVRCLGKLDLERYRKLKCIIATRILHSPMGSFKYKGKPTVPETGICLDLLNHMVIRADGKVSICVRFDPKGLGVIGDSTKSTLTDIWNGEKRRKCIDHHVEGRRDKVPLCSFCEFWGIPTGY